ncbi:MAG: PAS domain S-box protein [Calditrichaeota bacterium]|nr:MAG: PAS domain S-box protein [Calditrichota bacterium]MBL1206829.1 PAS domain S-box protein [Calditrichota bacterium]NOG46656.1 PAS domain S-box protein [Calditrichota bacterium]
MRKPINVLHLEDENNVVELVHQLLVHNDFQPVITHVQNQSEFISEIENQSYDLVIADFSLPNFDGLTALNLYRAANQKTPFIIFSGSIGEEKAIEILRNGATDYVLKENVNALIPAIKRALKEASYEQKEIDSQKELIRSKDLYYSTIQNLPIGLLVLNPKGQIIMVNNAFSDIINIHTKDVLNKTKIDELSPFDNPQIKAHFSNLYLKNKNFDFESPLLTTVNGKKIHLRCQGIVNKDTKGTVVTLLILLGDVTKRKKSEDDVKHFNKLFKESLNEIYIFDAETYYFIQVNQAAQNNLGFTMDELINLTLFEINSEYDKDTFAKRVKPLLKNKTEKFVFKTKHKRKDGSEYDAEVHLQLSDFKNKQTFTAIVLDITERRHAELAQHVIYRITSAGLKASNLSNIYAITQFELGQLMDTNNFFIGIYNQDEDTISFPYMEDEKDQFKVVPASNNISSFVVKNNQSLLLCGDDVEKFIIDNNIKRIGSPAKSWLGVPLVVLDEIIGLIVVQSYNDSYAYTQKHLELIEFIADQIASIIMKERIEIQLKDANKENEQLLASLPSILIVMDENERVVRWNKAAENSFGIKFINVVNKKLLESGILWDWPSIISGIGECRTQNTTLTLHDIEYTTIEEKNGFLNVTISPFVEEKKTYPGFLIICQDITDQKIMESQLSQAQKLESIGQLAAGIAHEINTPTQFVGDNTNFLKDAFTDFNDLINQFETLKENVKSQKEMEPIVSEIDQTIEEIDLSYLLEEVPLAIDQSLEGVSRVSKIVRAMKEFSHPGAKEKTSIDINKSIQNTITVCRNEWKYVSEIITEFDENLPPIPCIPDAFNQVILNLIINAAHAISDALKKTGETKGIINISTHLLEKEVEIRIKDSGTGIPEKAQPNIFDPFYTTKEVGKGTGQGLAISHDVITKKHNGSIKFETEKDKGTTFIIKLPV